MQLRTSSGGSEGAFCEGSRTTTPSVCDVGDAFPTAEKIRSLTPGVPHISTTMALLTSLIIDKRF